MNNTIHNTASGAYINKIPGVIITALLILYIANCFTPLRLTNDTVRYFNIKQWLEAGRPAGDPAGKDFLPYGYTWFLMILSKLNLAKSFFISLIHLLYLIGSLWFVSKMFNLAFRSWHFVALCLLNWATIKFVITPLSEMQFLFFSMGALFFYDRSEKKKKAIYLLIAFVFCVAAMLTRTAGFVLLIAFILTFLLKKRTQIKTMIKTNRLILPGLFFCLLVFAFLFKQFRIIKYIEDHSYYFEPFLKDPLSFVGNNIRYHLIDLSALSLNAPAPKINFLGSTLVNLIYLLAGIATLAWILYLLFRRPSRVSLLIKVYIICYMALIFNWPFFEPRFWVPIMPLFIAIILQEQNLSNKFVKFILSAYMLVYVLVGLTALGYYTYTSFNKKAFAVKQDAAIWRNEYETFFFGKPLTDSTAVVREPILQILKRYN